MAGRGKAYFAQLESARMKDCPDTEQLAVYLEHKLSPAERARFEAHFVACRICRKIVACVLKSEAVIPDPVIPQNFFS
jgi:hypothetical protein